MHDKEVPFEKSVLPVRHADHPEDLLTWPNGDTYERAEYEALMGSVMSDDFEVTPVDQRVDHLVDMSIGETCEQMMIALQAMGRTATVHFDNDAICLETDLTSEPLASGFTNALRKVASAVIIAEMPEVKTGLRSFGDVTFSADEVRFHGWKITGTSNEPVTTGEGRLIDISTILEPSGGTPAPGP